ncbi:Trehalose-phosphatase/synthase 7 isoform 1 [Hibiscus syriacus]|uniref:Trehalose-phosphatase/synthase 7 isoform 1 n=1 Tax=Hibiscus syriacus TaxID=106335 RepID=A0A6A3BTY6_HIBSY|nr:Trehalose-phosphatase/synthase 7 isoform 1 [Hibiscus syriacus]
MELEMAPTATPMLTEELMPWKLWWPWFSPVSLLEKQSHRCFVFESFVCKTMLEGFVSHDFGLTKEQYFNEFKSLKIVQLKHFLVQTPDSSFSKFAIDKYLKLVHPRMECSFFGNLNQREVVINGGFLETTFFTTYAEMGRRFWLLRCLGFSMSGQVSVFQVKRDCRFSDVYMENASEDR